LIGRRWHSSILNARSFREAGCDTDHYLVVAKVRDILAVSKLSAQAFIVGRFNLRPLNELEVRKQCQIKITDRFAAFENLNESKDINRTWDIKTSTKENLGLCELKQHKPWFDENCLGFLDQRKQAEMRWLQDPN
jgi:hypothetical protein